MSHNSAFSSRGRRQTKSNHLWYLSAWNFKVAEFPTRRLLLYDSRYVGPGITIVLYREDTTTIMFAFFFLLVAGAVRLRLTPCMFSYSDLGASC